MQDAKKYLKKREWSMGNDQCPDCEGVPPSWYRHPLHMTAASIGHEAGCTLAVALRSLGEKPLMKGEFTSDVEQEHYISDDGFYGTRPKTAEGCHRYRAAAAKMQEAWDASLLAVLSSAP
jgi:hypothetical protein